MTALTWLLAGTFLLPLVAILAGVSSLRPVDLRPRWLGASGLLNLANAAALFTTLVTARPSEAPQLTFGGWLSAPQGASFRALAPSLEATPTGAAIVLAVAFVLVLAAPTLRPAPGRARLLGVALPLVTLGAQLATLAGDLATTLVGLETMTLGVAILGWATAGRTAADPDGEDPEGLDARRGPGPELLLGPSLVMAAVGVLGLLVLVALAGTTRPEALPEALGGLPPQSRDIAQVALLVLLGTFLARAALLPIGGWLLRASQAGLGPLPAVVATVGFTAFSRLHLHVTDGFDAAVAGGCAPCAALRLDHLDALLAPVATVAALLASLGALGSRKLDGFAGWLFLGAQASALVALATAGAAEAALASLQALLAGAALLALTEGAPRVPVGPRTGPPGGGVMAVFTLASAGLLGLPPLASFVTRLATWRGLSDAADLAWLVVGLVAFAVGVLAFARAASRHLWRASSPSRPAASLAGRVPARLPLALFAAGVLLPTFSVSFLLEFFAFP
jgi:formate hydrogenlyase subunit 3/multisubunit Na+/H+ antiporter MnhD subunit